MFFDPPLAERPNGRLRDVYPTKYFKDEGIVEHILEIHDEELLGIVEEYIGQHADFEFDEIDLVNQRPYNVWLRAHCRTFVDPENPHPPEADRAEVEIRGPYPDPSPVG